MSAERDCKHPKQLIAEIALGIADAEQRAVALEHISKCLECGARLREATRLADGLLMLAPSEQPPPGFEERVLDELNSRSTGRGRIWPRARIAAVAAVAAVVAGAGVWLALADERDVAERYRSNLAEVQGEDFDAASLYAPGELEVGQVFGYQGSPSWTLVVIDSSAAPVPTGSYRLQLVTDSGRRVPFETIAIDSAGRGSEGGAIPIDFRDVAEVRMLGPAPGDAYSARFGKDGD